MATKVYREDGQDGWRIDIDSGGEKSTLTTRHVVFALGHGAGIPTFPEYPGMKDTFAGEILHSSAHKTAANHIGKKVVVIGSSTSSHDVCLDLAKHDIGTCLPLCISALIDVNFVQT
jgi:cation diffusion facilitator CzcD-associated flavoprotein CzcO